MLSHKNIVYDGNCPMCIALIHSALKWRFLPADKVVAFDALAPGLRPKVDPERFRNEMALIDTGDVPTLYGPDASLHILGEKYTLIRWLAQFDAFRQLIRPLYKTIAYNRYAISTPVPRPMRCACEPDSPPAYRYAWLVFALLFAIGITAAFGAALSRYFPAIEPSTGAGQMLLIAGTGWLLTLSWARLRLENWLEYAAHLGAVMLRGVLILVPFILWEYATGIQHFAIPTISVLLSSYYMFRQHRVRSAYLLLAPAWQWRWFWSLQMTATLWVATFYALDLSSFRFL
jgi:predicted DCC family thiol-disulfide oxidoreductase YuxK